MVVCTRVPLVPVIVMVLVPASAPLAAVRVRVVVPEDVSDTGLNFPVTFAGNPLTENFVTPTNPKLGVSVRATLPLIPPRVIATALGEADIEKSPGEFTNSWRGAVRSRVPLLPLTVMV